VVQSRQKAKPVGRVHLVVVCLVVILLVAGFEVQKHREGSTAADAETAAISVKSPEGRLAAIQPVQRPDRLDSTVKRLASMLDILEADCPANTRRDLADLTVKSLHELERSGISASPTQILGGVLGSSDIGALSDCSRFFARYVTRRRHEGQAARS
jgi:hypothetical protein